MNFSLQDEPCSNQVADSWFPTAVISHFYSAVYVMCEQRGVNFYQFVQDYLSGKTRTIPPGPAQNQTAIAV